MKTTRTVLFLFALVFFHESHAQSGVVEYRSIYYDMPNVEKDEGFKRKTALEINDMGYELRYNAKVSYFEELPRVPHDDFMGRIASAIAYSDMPWYQDSRSKNALRNKKIKDSMYIVDHSVRMGGWTLHNESKEIDGYLCYKATKHHVQYYTEIEFTIEAWYTPEIPFPYGPAGFGGLPGLILQLERSHVIYVADRLNLNPKEGIKPIEELAPGRMISEDEMHLLMRRARKVTQD